MIDWIVNFYNNHSSVLLYYAYLLPLMINLVVFTQRIVMKYRHDIKHYTDSYYSPSLTLGTIIAYLLGTVTPIVNSVVLVFNTLPSAIRILADVFEWLLKTLDIPLVPHRPKNKL